MNSLNVPTFFFLPMNILSARDGNFEMGDSNIATITAPADGNDFIAMMAEGLRSQLASQGIHVKPFNSTE